ncbi:unnamed protein product [Adineta steineri]|uniref:Glycolipid transfer protein domain-containing protein n=1 Tax=Adineta steineri TaxID=433720 RepID=A0A818RXC2_9BILA|nr:unnamed protein product [Adineta steineri]CAF3655310.1 unnamed protein product [Adineta steineri]
MNTTRLILKNNYDLFIPISNDKNITLKNNYYNSFLLYFDLPNSPITVINDLDDMIVSTTELDNSDEQILCDIDNNESNIILYETFFSQLVHKFSVFNNLSFEEFPAELFLKTCEDYFSLVDKFNSSIFTPMKSDVNGNITKLRKKINENPMKFQTLFAIINDEIESQTTTARNSATDALLWLKRAFEFISSFLHEFGMGDKTLSDAVGKGYDQSLKQYHGMLARSIFSFALRAVPNNTQFLYSLAVSSTDASEILFEHQVFNEMLEHASHMSSALEKITLFYSEHRLEQTKIVT